MQSKSKSKRNQSLRIDFPNYQVRCIITSIKLIMSCRWDGIWNGYTHGLELCCPIRFIRRTRWWPLTYAKIDVALAAAHDQHIGSLVGEGQSTIEIGLLQHGHRYEEFDRIPVAVEGKLSVGHATERHLTMGIGCQAK